MRRLGKNAILNIEKQGLDEDKCVTLKNGRLFLSTKVLISFKPAILLINFFFTYMLSYQLNRKLSMK